MQKIAKKQATVETVQRTNYTNPNGRQPIKLRVTYDRKAKFYPISFEGKPLLLSPDEWKEINSLKCRSRLKVYVSAIEKIKAMAAHAEDRITRDGKPFTWAAFEKEFLQQDSSKGFLKLFFDHLQTIRAENRIGTYKSYLNAYNSFTSFRKDKDFSPFDLSVEMLKAYEAHLIKNGCGKTTIGIYARALKVIYNLAADKNQALLETYPFARKQTDRNRYKIRTGSGHKGDALSIEQLKKFIAITTDPFFPEHEAKLLWLFSFYCQGMNMKDICLLKYQNIKGELITYVRAKTKDTEAQESLMEVPLTDPIRTIINAIGNPDKSPNSYLFPVIPNGLGSTVKRRTSDVKTTEERIDEIIRQKIKMVNKFTKQLCKDSKDPDLKDLNLTTYWARHSYANLMKEAGESVELIRELLGHSDIRTTENYLKRFDLLKKRSANEKLESLLKVS